MTAADGSEATSYIDVVRYQSSVLGFGRVTADGVAGTGRGHAWTVAQDFGRSCEGGSACVGATARRAERIEGRGKTGLTRSSWT